MNKLNSREQKATELRRAISLFRKKYGMEKTVGIESAIKTDFLSSEITEEEDNSMSSRGRGKILKVKRVPWRGQKVNSKVVDWETY
jgi:hypothetical protein